MLNSSGLILQISERIGLSVVGGGGGGGSGLKIYMAFRGGGEGKIFKST